MNYNRLEKPIQEENSDPKNRKTENQREYEKASFCSNNVFSLYFKIRVKKFHAAKQLASLQLLFWRGQNHHINLISKMKMCEQILNIAEEFQKGLEIARKLILRSK